MLPRLRNCFHHMRTLLSGHGPRGPGPRGVLFGPVTVRRRLRALFQLSDLGFEVGLLFAGRRRAQSSQLFELDVALVEGEAEAVRDRQLVVRVERQLDARLALLLAVHRLGRLPIVVAHRCRCGSRSPLVARRRQIAPEAAAQGPVQWQCQFCCLLVSYRR